MSGVLFYGSAWLCGMLGAGGIIELACWCEPETWKAAS